MPRKTRPKPAAAAYYRATRNGHFARESCFILYIKLLFVIYFITDTAEKMALAGGAKNARLESSLYTSRPLHGPVAQLVRAGDS